MQPSTTRQQQNKHSLFVYSLRATAFLLLIFANSFIINCIQLAGTPLALVSRRHYRQWMRQTQKLFTLVMVVATYCFSPLEIVLTGDHMDLNNKGISIIMANHQIYTDWWYIWLLSWFKNAHGDLKILLKKELQYIPILGWGMYFFEFIFMARNWSKDRTTLVNTLERCKQDQMPLWLLIFPEGTVVTAETQAVAFEYAKKIGWTDLPEHVLLPKSTGLYCAIKTLQSSSSSLLNSASSSLVHGSKSSPGTGPKYLYDLTIGYSGISSRQNPFSTYSLARVFFDGSGPRRVYIHVTKFEIASIPGLDAGEAKESLRFGEQSRGVVVDDRASAAFSLWLRQRFLEKDAMMKGFYQHGEFLVPAMPSLSVDTQQQQQQQQQNGPTNAEYLDQFDGLHRRRQMNPTSTDQSLKIGTKQAQHVVSITPAKQDLVWLFGAGFVWGISIAYATYTCVFWFAFGKDDRPDL